MECNPTGKMPWYWRASSKTRAPYPDDLPISERALWDLKSNAEVTLARKLKRINKDVFIPRDGSSVWEKWWLRRNQKDGGDWQNKEDIN